MDVISGSSRAEVVPSDWYRSLAKYEKPSLRMALWQVVNTVLPYAALFTLMVWMLRAGISYWFVLPISVPAAGLLVRIFIFFHDCCHGSFFESRMANRICGFIFGVLVFTPYEDWRVSHAGHHSGSGDLDRRGLGDIETLTVEEYLAAPKSKQLYYRLTRNPFVLFVLVAPVMFLLLHRFPQKHSKTKERNGIAFTNLAILAIGLLAMFTIGLQTYLLVQLPIICLAGSLGVWLFYVQHQFEGEIYWDRHEDWDPIRAALEGSSYFKLPKVLQWFSGNIGLHHIHHLRPRIPNYRLQSCYDNTPALQAIKPITLRTSLKSLFLNLWDESNRKLVSFRSVRRRRRTLAATTPVGGAVETQE